MFVVLVDTIVDSVVVVLVVICGVVVAVEATSAEVVFVDVVGSTVIVVAAVVATVVVTSTARNDWEFNWMRLSLMAAKTSRNQERHTPLLNLLFLNLEILFVRMYAFYGAYSCYGLVRQILGFSNVGVSA